ncbi:hypothetical protein RoseRS_1219 [Roseiflexus sp. RS-1]|jgi:hypothetical protein|nr:hypothetical protein RoseRS_1219 [Roseiflexus sp. RS-1]
MITRDKVYFSLAMVTCIIQATGLLVTLAGSVVDEGRGFYIFWISICIAVLLHGFILATSSRSFVLSSKYAVSAVLISTASLVAIIFLFLIKM